MRSQPQGDEAGFTLMEVLIATIVAGILLVGVTSGFIVALHATTGTSDRFIESHDAQLLATYYPSDVQSAFPNSVDTNAGTGTGCSGASVGTNVLRLQWTQTVPTTTAYSVSYRIYSPASGSWELRRYFCTGSPTTSSAPSTYQVVAHDLADPSNPPSITRSAGAEISLTLYASKAASESSAYSYTFTASMRTPGSPVFLVSVLPPANPLQLVAGTTFNVSLTASNNGSTPDATYSGTKTVIFSGPHPSPSASPPVYAASVTFTNGVGTAPVTLYDTETTILTATEGEHSGTSALTVGPALVPLTFHPCPPATPTGATTAETIVRGTDPYGNADPNLNTSVTVNLAATSGGISPSPVTISPNQTTSTGATYTNPATSGTAVTLSGTTTATGYSSASCAITTTGPVFLVSAPTPQTAGGHFDVTLTASNDGTTPDTSYTGAKTVTFSGPANAPMGTAPIYPATVNFASGVGTASITLFDAQSVTLSATDGTHAGTVPLTVSAASVPLTFPSCGSINTAKNKSSAETIARASTDAYGNSDPNLPSPVTVNLSATGGGTFNPTSVSIAANQATSASSSSYSNPSTSGVAITLTGHAATAGYSDATCPFTTTP
jgi:prepilin-type N-terminal cleavage/methylation domain-containing protein